MVKPITKVYIISDTHFNDEKLIKHRIRPYDNVHDMNEALIKCWNMRVKPDDICIHLGDVALDCPDSLLCSIISRLNGQKVLVKGNWEHLENKRYLDIGFKKVYDKATQIGNYVLSHVPVSTKFMKLNPDFENYHGHSHKYQYGRQFVNCNIDVMGYKPKLVNLWGVKKENLL